MLAHEDLQVPALMLPSKGPVTRGKGHPLMEQMVA
jgi:hypothetical protein